MATLNQRFRGALKSFFLRRIQNHAEADDLTQEVFFRLAGSSIEIETAHAYVFRVAANLLRDRARAEHTRMEYRQGLGALEQGRVEALDPDRVLTAREELARTLAGLAELPERTRWVFVLYRLENMTRIEIARGFGISVSAVEKHVARAMAHLTRARERDQ